MATNKDLYQSIVSTLNPLQVQLVAVSKTKPNEDILELYHLGQKDFGENYVQELIDKAATLPTDIRWHFIGHLQTNKVKYIAPFVHLIHGVDSEKLLIEINKQSLKQNRVIDCLLQVHIATEETKFGFDKQAILDLVNSENLATYKNIRIRGLMGMASLSDDQALLSQEFEDLKEIFDQTKYQMRSTHFDILSMGMSADYALAISKGSNMVRIGSLLFGNRNYNK